MHVTYSAPCHRARRWCPWTNLVHTAQCMVMDGVPECIWCTVAVCTAAHGRNIGICIWSQYWCTMLLAIFGALSGFQHHRCNCLCSGEALSQQNLVHVWNSPFQVKSFSFIDYWFLGAKLKMQSLKARKKMEQISSEWQNCRQYSWSSNLHLICKKIEPCMP